MIPRRALPARKNGTENMEQTKLKRSGQRPLAFTGEQLLATDDKTLNSTRWTKVSVHKTKAGRFVVGVGHMTCWQGESDSYKAEAFDSLDDVISYIEENAPNLAGYAANALGVAEHIE